MLRIATTLLAAICGADMMLAATAGAQTQPPGQETYWAACGPCHGEQGRGDGPMRQFLTVAPTDLTTLRQRNGGDYPFNRVYQMIDGRSMIPAHGTREMPVWGGVFALRANDGYGPFNTETYVRGRIVEIVTYLESLQR